MFTDRAKVKLVAGKGGNGVVAWRREKFIRKGGPAGGDGGHGGSITFQVDPNINSLEWYRDRWQIKAEPGQSGGSGNKRGKNGKSLVLKLPAGTLIKDPLTGEVLVDMTENGQEWTACEGGKGGRGNTQFKSPTNQAPTKATPGKLGQALDVELELKLIADVGFVGYPNAGKSTLINGLAHVRVKIAPYPFTTLSPNLGFVQFDDFSRILIADIPGIIEGAHENRGLGFAFLRHIERTGVLVFVLDASGIDGRTPAEDFRVLQRELANYDKQDLTQKPFLVALNKIDEEESRPLIEEFAKEHPGQPFHEISALTGLGLDEFLEAMRALSQRDGKRF